MEEDKKIICSHCGRSVAALDTLCPYCGAELRPAMTKKKKRKLKGAVLLVVVLLGIAMLNGDRIREAYWDLRLDLEEKQWEEEKFEDFEYEFYTIPQEQWDALNEGDFYMAEDWEQQFQDLSQDQREALKILKGKVKHGISRKEALRDLQREGYSEEDALIVVEAANIDFPKMALKVAYDFLEMFAYSESGLASQLESCGFTEAEAAYAAENCGADWDQQAKIQLMQMMEWGAWSEIGYLIRLEEQGYTKAQAEQAVASMNIDWNIQVSRKAGEFLEYEKMDREKMISQLEYEGFPREQAAYGADAVGLK